MKSTGIVRKVDELGRVVIPIEIRRRLHKTTDQNTMIFDKKCFFEMLSIYKSFIDIEWLIKKVTVFSRKREHRYFFDNKQSLHSSLAFF